MAKITLDYIARDGNNAIACGSAGRMKYPESATNEAIEKAYCNAEPLPVASPCGGQAPKGEEPEIKTTEKSVTKKKTAEG